MAVTGTFWAGGQNDDIHVLRGHPSRRLDNLLVIQQSPGANFFANDAAAKTAAGVTNVQFLPIFPFTLATHGVSVNTATGEVTAGAAPAGPFPRNFIIKATVTAGSGTFVVPIRVHIHSSVSAVSLTPSTLTARQEPPGVAASTVSFSVFAEFDDGVFGDISRYGDPAVAASRMVWQSLTPSAASVDADGNITALASTGLGTIQVTLPAELGGATAQSTVILSDGWSTQRTAKAVPGSAGTTPTPNLLNLLLFPDGFIDGEEAKFEEFAHRLLAKWRSSPTLAPFDTMPLNVFTVWVPSSERGSTVRNLLRYRNRTSGKRRASALPTPEEPPATQVPRVQKLTELLFQVGLPTPTEATASLATKQAEWNTLYGPNHVGVLTAAVYRQWTDLNDYTLAFERNTAFGSRSGQPPQVADPDDGRGLGFHPRRASRADIDKMLTNLVDAAGVNIGATWLTGLGRVTVGIMAAGGRNAGARSRPPNEMIFSSVSTTSNDTLLLDVTGRHIADQNAYDIPSHMLLDTVATFAHESGHGLTLGDEYGGSASITGTSDEPDARTNFPNLQDDLDVRDATGVRGSLIFWKSWPRISTAGVVSAAVTGVNPTYDVPIRTDPRSTFAVGDTVALRHRPFFEVVGTAPNLHLGYRAESPQFTITSITPGSSGTVIRVQRAGTGTFNAADWVPDKTILFRPQGTSMVHTKVVQAIDASHSPLNRVAPAACTADDSSVQRMAVSMATLGLRAGTPKYGSWIVGLFDGGREYHCGIYHPRGTCLMRSLQVESRQKHGIIYNLCPVCRYIIVDQVEPALHGDMDRLYDKIYPVAL